MKLHFLGANRQVTGSRYCLEASGKKVMIDCGMFQERQFQGRNWAPSPIPPHEIDAMLLTHVHIDHLGLIPKLVNEGFRNPIYATRPSVELAEIMLRDSAQIQMEDAAYKRHRHSKERRHATGNEVSGNSAEPVYTVSSKFTEKNTNSARPLRAELPLNTERPLYTDVDVDQTLPLFRAVPYLKSIRVTEDIEVTFHDAGHILGSAMLEVVASEHGKSSRILFSGDIGQWNKPLIRDPTLFDHADYVVMESTYGDRDHESAGEVETQLADVINETVRRGGNVVIPTFAVERAQELMYFIGRLVHASRIPEMPIYLDSPMSVDVTEIYLRCQDCFDTETIALMTSKQPPLRFPGLRFASTVQESQAINGVKRPCIIMASSGMCNAGRIKHHLRRNISRPESTILFVGFQSQGTLGRQIVDGAKYVRIHGRESRVLAQVSRIFGFSGHSDRSGLVRWISHLKQPPRHIYLTHGELQAALSLETYIRQTLGWSVSVPEFQECLDLC